MWALCMLLLWFGLAASVRAYRYDPLYIAYNLNTNKSAIDPTHYSGSRYGHQYTASPSNWRFPFYTVLLDRFVNGDPFNDNINGTAFEHDMHSNQMRHGGDVQGLINSLDYLQGMGIKGLFIAGSVFLNLPWVYDSYSPVDLSLLDPHFGDLKLWQDAVSKIHARGMYIIVDNTFNTLGDLIGFEGYLNESAPFTVNEHRAIYKSSRQYTDFHLGNAYNTTCTYPAFWNETGYPVDMQVKDELAGCYDSDFDQYGDTEAFGVYPDYRRQLTKFASVQDRLREWHPPVLSKLENFYCMLMTQLDIDGFRYDKALQTTVDAFGAMNKAMRECGAKLGKNNLFLAGEITGGNSLASVWLGRGRQPDMLPPNLTEAITSGHSTQAYSIRTPDLSALDAAAFHYSVYRTLTRFLGMDGNLEAGYDTPANLVDMWNTMLLTNDMTNANTGEFDPRHMYGTMNQDVFRWPAIQDGIYRQLLGNFVTTMMLPGIPLLLWGEEQEFYVLDNTASNYIFGRQPLSASSAWQTHGCYSLDSTQYYNYPVDSARNGCHDERVSSDHRDPSAPVRSILKHMFDLRQTYPVLNDGAWLQQLSNQTWQVSYPGSSGVATETGLWSVLRSAVPAVQNFGDQLNGNVSIWLMYSNLNATKEYHFDCSDVTPSPSTRALLAPFDAGLLVRNLFYPYETVALEPSAQFLGINGSTNASGCMNRITMEAYDFKAFVPIENWVAPRTRLTKIVIDGDESNGHDARILSRTSAEGAETVPIQLFFSAELDCQTVTESVYVRSTTLSGRSPSLDLSTVRCSSASEDERARKLQGHIQSVWSWSADLVGVENGAHRVSVDNSFKDAYDHFLFRIGQADNPVVFPRSANYSSSLLARGEDGNLYLQHKASGANLWRYTTNWASTYSSWMPYSGGKTLIEPLPWTGTSEQSWKGTHVRVEYFSRSAGSSDIIQEADLEDTAPRRFPHLSWNGPYNAYGFDSGMKNSFVQEHDGTWRFDFMTEWPAVGQVNVWNLNPNGQPDQTYVMGDINGDSVLDRLPPSSLAMNMINMSVSPPKSSLGWTIQIDDASRHFQLSPAGSAKRQIILFALLSIIPLLFAGSAVFAFMRGFYKIKFNQSGMTESVSQTSEKFRAMFTQEIDLENDLPSTGLRRFSRLLASHEKAKQVTMLRTSESAKERRTVLIATMEYDIEDWKIKVKIGGLGVMAQLMGKALEHQDLIWVIPCIGGVAYPIDTPAEPFKVTVLGSDYSVQVQYHQFKNIRYVLLDAPVFRQQTQAEPYPTRMDDMNSAIYYSAWNQCIAQTIRRFPIDLYHINDYHGTVAPLYLLPRTIPVCFSLHNAEFQGLWPMRTSKECTEICEVFNLTPDIVQRFVQFGEIFNLLHAGASLLRVWQQGFGAVGVSKKYGQRVHLRYPIFWGLRKIGQLPNPDPTDTAEWTGALPREKDIKIDTDFEAARPKYRLEAQRWAGLEEDETAELFVFVGRWSNQKGVDLIADIFPSILRKHPKTQLICIGPVIDLYGKFAALKLEKLMEEYPKRVLSKPVFTALPPCIFSGAEFALIPSRDEPFGLVAVEFGRKGALGVGARVGGLGNMPGWWYTVEAVTTSHLLHQFRLAIEEALSSKSKLRALMRARSAKQRFPVAQWVDSLDTLQSTAIRIHAKVNATYAKQDRQAGRQSHCPSEVVEHPEFDDIGPLPVNFSRGRYSESSLRVATPRSSMDSVAFINNVPNARRKEDSTSQQHNPDEIRLDARSSMSDVPRSASSGLYSHASSSFAATASLNRSISTPALPQYPSQISLLTTDAVVGERKNYLLQQVDPFFTDSQGVYYNAFSKKLDKAGAIYENSTCIEEYLVKSEKEWYHMYLNAKLGRKDAAVSAKAIHVKTRATSAITSRYSRTPVPSIKEGTAEQSKENESISSFEEFLMGETATPPHFLARCMQSRIGDWPVYSFLLALGQIMAANSYQITLLTGQIGQAADRVYVLCGIYIAASAFFWLAFRRFQSATILTLPFALYGVAFLMIGLARYGSTPASRGWIQNGATGFYAAASASGSLYFALNFGDEGGSTVQSWIFRACVIQGTQQAYVTALWFWGSYLNRQSALNVTTTASSIINSWKVTAICVPIAVALWLIGAIIYFGLPSYYHRVPGRIPSFYTTVLRRKIILWLFVMVLVQNFFLSAQYGRSWSFLWSSTHVPYWQVACLVIGFFVVLWAFILWGLSLCSHSHSWLLPILGVGLGAPRWAQIWWGTSGMASWLPWAGSYAASALVARSLWLWLGVLDTVQGVGIGMILLSTMTRIHVTFTLIAAQIIGAATTAVARACAPDNLGPGPVFPNVLTNIDELHNAWFWIGLLLNGGICIGFFLFFRKEQLSKP